MITAALDAEKAVSHTVLLLPAHLNVEMEQLMRGACEQAGVQCTVWDGREASTGTPSLLMAALPRNQRRVPDLASRLVNQVYAELPMLLVSQDALVRDPVTLNDGAITLTGAPLTREKLMARIRASIAARPSALASAIAANATVSEQTSDGLHLRECNTPRAWFRSVARHVADAPERTAPPITYSASLGFVAALSDKKDTDTETFDEAAAFSRRFVEQFGSAELLAALTEKQTSMLALNASASHWKIVAPDAGNSAASAWLYSRQRIPRASNLTRVFARGTSPFAALEAASGDLVALTSGFELAENHDAFCAAAVQGGRALFEYAQACMHAHPHAVAAVVAEVL